MKTFFTNTPSKDTKLKMLRGVLEKMLTKKRELIEGTGRWLSCSPFSALFKPRIKQAMRYEHGDYVRFMGARFTAIK